MSFLYRNFAWLAPLITFGGFISYFLVFAKYPTLRDFPWVNLPLVLIGAGLAIGGLMRAWKDARWGKRVFYLFSAGFSVVVAGFLVLYVFVISNQMPEAAIAEEKLVAGVVAPAFTLANANGETVSLSDFAGKKVVISFYRGFW